MADPQNAGGLAVAFAAASALAWGAGDFSGGLASKRATALSVMPISTSVGLLVLAAVAAVRRAPMVTSHDALFAFLGGVFGVVGTLGLYQALANGKMGIAAPLSAAIANAIALLYGALTEGLPHPLQGIGFLLAIGAVWCIARAREDAPRTSREQRGWLFPATLSGVGFGLFFSFNAQFTASDISWAVVEVRLVTWCLIVVMALVSRRSFRGTAKSWALVLLVGVTSALGDLSYALATRLGRLDVGAVLSSLYPLVTVGLATVILRERLTRAQWAGVALALSSVVLIVL
jgi:drug/metabolite transporter (DMT)-like permease